MDRHRSRHPRRALLAVATAVVMVGSLLVAAPAEAAGPVTTAPPPTLPSIPELLGASSTTTTAPTSTTTGSTPTTTAGSSSTTTTTTTLPPSAFSTSEPAPPKPTHPIHDPLYAARVVADQLQARIEALKPAVASADHSAAVAAAAARRAERHAAATKRTRDAAASTVRGDKKQLAEDVVVAYVRGGAPTSDQQLGPTDDQLSSRTYLGSLMTQHRARLDADRRDLTRANEQHEAATDASAKARHHADDTAAAAKTRHDQLDGLKAELSHAVTELDAVAASSKPLTLAQIGALLRRYDARFGTADAVPPASKRAEAAVTFALQQVGKPYVWGGNGPDSYDCSGLTQQSWLRAGVLLPRVAADQQAWAVPIPATAAQPGDLVFYGTPAFHVGIYLGNQMMVDAPHQGAFVRVERIWRSSFSGFGRVRTG